MRAVGDVPMVASRENLAELGKEAEKWLSNDHGRQKTRRMVAKIKERFEIGSKDAIEPYKLDYLFFLFDQNMEIQSSAIVVDVLED